MALERIYAVALLTLKESARKKVAVGMIVCSVLMTLALGLIAKATQVTAGSDLGQVVAVNLLLHAVGAFTWVLALFVSLTAIPTEIERRTTYTLFSKPLERFEFVFGKFLGCSALLGVNLGISAALAYAMVYPENQGLAWALVLNLGTYLVSRMALVALTVSLTLFLPMAVAGLISLGMYFLASAYGYGQTVQEATQLHPLWRALGQGVYVFGKYATPRINWLNVDRPAIEVVNQPQPVAIAAVLAYCLVVLMLGSLAFSRREL